jgi:PKD repeat protein
MMPVYTPKRRNIMFKKIVYAVIIMLCALILTVNEPYVNSVKGDEVSCPGEQILLMSFHPIKVATQNSTILFGGGWGAMKEHKQYLNYSWIVDNDKYYFQVGVTNTSSLQDYGELSQYNVLIMSGMHDEHVYCGLNIKKPFTFMNNTIDPELIKSNLEKFVKTGHGYIGHCSSGAFAVNISHEPQTLLERFIERNTFLNTTYCNATVNVQIGFPVVDEHFNLVKLNTGLRRRSMPELIGQIGLVYYSGVDIYNLSQTLGGYPVNVTIRDRSHPILRDYVNDTWCVRFGGGQSYQAPLGNINYSRLCDFPDITNPKIQTIAWRYPLLPNNPAIEYGIMELIKIAQDLRDGQLNSLLHYNEILPNITDWQQKLIVSPQGDTGVKYLDMQVNNQTAALAFNYPEGSENGGRVVISGFHVDLPVWNLTRKYIEDCYDTLFTNKLGDGLYRWRYDVNNTPNIKDDDRFLNESDLIRDTNDWFLRREVAWASKIVPDNSLPPIYGRSQIVDIEPALQTNANFTLQCCVGKFNDEYWSSTNLSLFYRYIGANSSYTWTNWTLSDSINTTPYRFQFNASNANGSGLYEFCSILKTNSYNESFPPAADAWCGVGSSILSIFRHEPVAPYAKEKTYFYSEALTKNNTHITIYNWNFGDGIEISASNAKNVTHTYPHSGTFTVNFTVTNNLSQKSSALLNISVLNNPPETEFLPNFTIAFVYQQINFTDRSTDLDGHLVNWSWDFGDGHNSSAQNPQHAYNTSDFYTVSLKVTDNQSGTDTETKPLSVLVINTLVNGSLLTDLPQNHKWKTIQKAIDNSSTKDLIYVINGTYVENLTINKSILLIGENKDNVIIQGSVNMVNPYDYELPAPNIEDETYFMNGTELLMHFNNDTDVKENYTTWNNVYDYSGHHHNGSRYGATWTTSTLKGAGCFDFDGNDDSINLTSIPAFSGVNVTVSAWVYWNGGSGDLDPIVSQVNTSGHGYCLSVNATTRKPFFQLNETMVISSQALSFGWHNIVGTHNETKLSIYVDGVLKGIIDKTGCGVTYGVATGGFIGFDNAKDYFDGRIDEVAIWNRTLSGDDISAIRPSSEISVLYHENYGVYMEGFTICDAFEIGMLPCNRSEVSNCFFLNNPTGIMLHDVYDVRIYKCTISGGITGIGINESYPNDYNRIRLVDCVVDDVSHAILVNESANVSIFNNLVNGSLVNLTFTGCNFSSMDIWCSTSIHNVAPDMPGLSGPILGDAGESYTYTAVTNDSNRDQILYFFDWGDGNNTGWIGNLYGTAAQARASHEWKTNGGYYVNVKAKDVFNNESNWSQSLLFRTETSPPDISSVVHSPDTVGFGFNVTIQADVADRRYANDSGVKLVSVNISYPDHTYGNYTMTHTTGGTYQYVFNGSWLVGQFNYTIWALDNAYNMRNSSGHHFHVSATATISIATLKNSYSGIQYINITDPPNPPENLTLLGRGLTWNTYYNASSGENILEAYQGPVNYQQDNGTWTPINYTISQLTSNHPAYVYGYRNGNDHGLFGVYFKSNAQNDWPVAFTYNRSDDPTIHAIRSKLVGVGYVDPSSNWAYQYLQNVQSSQGQTNDYSITYPGVFTGTDVTWSYGNTELKEEITLSNVTKTVLQNHPPSQYGLNDASSYLVFITKLDHQNLGMYNASGMLTGNVTISDTGVDFKDVLGQFKCALPLGEAYELNNESVRQKLIYRIVHLNGDTYLLSGLKVSDLNAMTFPVVIDPTLSVNSLSNDGYIYSSSTTYSTARDASSGTVSSSATYLSIGQRKDTGVFPSMYYIYRGFVLFNTSTLPSNAILDSAVLSLYKNDDYSTTDFSLTIQNGQPTYPHNPLQSTDYAKSRYSGNGGSLNTSSYTSGRNNITLTNLSWINTTGTTKLCMRSSRDINGNTPTGAEYINVYSANAIDPNPQTSYKPKLIITYRNQSKIKNTGSTNIKGYLLIQVQFYNTSQSKWIVDNDTINETTSRTINIGSQLALDTIFNGKIRASNLQHGTGNYRVYATFRDPEGNILKTNNGVELKAWWQFSKT